MGLRDELDKAIEAEATGATPDTWVGYFKANRWKCIGLILMFIVVLIGLGADWK
jgi:hypothetical protein